MKKSIIIRVLDEKWKDEEAEEETAEEVQKEKDKEETTGPPTPQAKEKPLKLNFDDEEADDFEEWEAHDPDNDQPPEDFWDESQFQQEQEVTLEKSE